MANPIGSGSSSRWQESWQQDSSKEPISKEDPVHPWDAARLNAVEHEASKAERQGDQQRAKELRRLGNEYGPGGCIIS